MLNILYCATIRASIVNGSKKYIPSFLKVLKHFFKECLLKYVVYHNLSIVLQMKACARRVDNMVNSPSLYKVVVFALLWLSVVFGCTNENMVLAESIRENSRDSL